MDRKGKYVSTFLEFSTDNIYVEFCGQIFQKKFGLPMGTYCAPFLADLFVNGYEAEFIQGLLNSGKKTTDNSAIQLHLEKHR